MAEKKSTKIKARELALLALQKVEQEGAYANLILRQLLCEHPLSAEETRLATELTYGSVRMRAALDYILAQLLRQPLAKLPVPIRQILRLSLYQLLYMDRIPPSAAVNQAVELAKRYGHKGTASLVNGVLRGYLRQSEQGQQFLPARADLRDYLITTLSYPEWLIDRLLKLWPEEDVLRFCLFHNQYQGLSLRNNSLKQTRAELLAELVRQGMRVQAGLFAPEAVLVTDGAEHLSALLPAGRFLPQGEASMLAAYALDPVPGSTVIDLCAAPGGKTTHLAQLMQNQGSIHAIDLYPHRVKLIEDNARRLGITIIQAEAADGRTLPAHYCGKADFLLLDAPCTGLGVLGRRADARWRKKPEDVAQLQALSYELLLAAADYLKPGGVLCYATCTVLPAENEENIARFLAARKDFQLQPLTRLAALFTEQADREAAAGGMIQLLPQKQGLEGFFLCRLVKQKG